MVFILEISLPIIVKLSKEPYENKKCIIRQGILVTASMNREKSNE